MRVKHRGSWWRVKESQLPDDWGCVTFGLKLMEIDPNQKGKRRLNTLVHEAQHMDDFDLSHTKIKRLATLIVKLLWADGWRWNPDLSRLKK